MFYLNLVSYFVLSARVLLKIQTNMEYFKTPIRRKAYKFHSQIRTESLSKMKTTVRAVNDLTAKKQSQNDQFNKLC